MVHCGTTAVAISIRMALPFWDSSCYPKWDSSCYPHTSVCSGLYDNVCIIQVSFTIIGLRRYQPDSDLMPFFPLLTVSLRLKTRDACWSQAAFTHIPVYNVSPALVVSRHCYSAKGWMAFGGIPSHILCLLEEYLLYLGQQRHKLHSRRYLRWGNCNCPAFAPSLRSLKRLSS